MSGNYQQKRKRENGVTGSHVDTSKPTAVFQPSGGRSYTVSVAVPGSIIANAHTHDIKSSLAGQLARAFAVFCVDEVIIFNDGQTSTHRTQHLQQRQGRPQQREKQQQLAAQDEAQGYTAFADPDNFLYHLLSYLETPPYLRRSLFQHHPNLKTAGSLPSLDMPHHLRADDWCRFREGVTLAPGVANSNSNSNSNSNNNSNSDQFNNKTAKAKRRKTDQASSPSEDSSNAAAAPSAGTYVNVGLPHPVHVADHIPPNTRVTVDLGRIEPATSPVRLSEAETAALPAQAVRPEAPREEDGFYWGYTTRLAGSLGAVFTECAFDDSGDGDTTEGAGAAGAAGYDFCIGTSERGEPLPAFQARPMPAWRHLLLVFGGVAGLERAVQNDPDLAGQGVSRAQDLFDAYVNLLPNQGSRTIRTEEAVWLGLMGLNSTILAGHR